MSSIVSMRSQPGKRSTDNNTSTFSEAPSQQLPPKRPFHRTKEGMIIIILMVVIVIGAVVGGAVGGTRASAAAAAERSAANALASAANVLASATITTVPTTSVISTTITSTLPASITTLSAPSPTPSNCVWEGTAPFCDGKCHTGFTQIEEDNCGNGDCCSTGFKVYCCQE